MSVKQAIMVEKKRETGRQNFGCVNFVWYKTSRAGLPMLRTEGQGFESRLCQGLSLAGSRWSDLIGSSLQGRGEDSAT